MKPCNSESDSVDNNAEANKGLSLRLSVEVKCGEETETQRLLSL